jgi:hypothetical protein
LAWLKQFEHDDVRRFSSRNTRSTAFRFPWRYTEIGVGLLQGSMDVVSAINEKRCGLDIMFPAEFL